MEDAAVLQGILRHVRLREHHVRAGVAVEGEVPVPAGQGLDEGQGGAGVRVPDQAAGADARLPDHIDQHIAEHIRPHLAQEEAAAVQLLEHGQDVAGRAAGVGLEEGVPLGAQAVFREVHEQFAQGDDVKGLG